MNQEPFTAHRHCCGEESEGKVRIQMLFGCLLLGAFMAPPASAAYQIYQFQGTGTATNGYTMDMTGFFTFDPSLITTDASGELFSYSDPNNPSLTTNAHVTAYGDTLTVAFTNQGYDQSVTINFVSGFLGSTIPTGTQTIDFGNVISASFSGAYFRSDQPPVSGRTTGFQTVLLDGSFSSSGQLVALPAVPELSTWSMMLVGFTAVGFALRRRASVAITG